MTDFRALFQMQIEAEGRPPVPDADLALLEASVRGPLPTGYVDFLRFSDGLTAYSDLVFSAAEAVAFNRTAWDEGFAAVYMPFHGMYFFGEDANADRFFFRQLSEGLERDVYLWRHENDSRIWIANDLSDFLTLYLSGKYDDL